MDCLRLFEKASKAWEEGEVKKAFDLFNKAAIAGDPSSQHNLGYFYDIGIGRNKDRIKAMYWYKKAAKNGEVHSCLNIAEIYKKEENLRRAIFWLSKAVNFGDGDAALELAKLYLEKGTKGAEKKAHELLRLVLKSISSTPDSINEAKNLLDSVDS